MKKLLTILLLIAAIPAWGQSLTAGQQIAFPLHRTDGTTSTETRVYIYVPWDYFTSGKKYPVIFFFPGNNGVGNGGSDMTKLLTQDLPYQIDQGKAPYSAKWGDTTRFVVTTYQPSSSSGISSSNLANWVSTLQYYGVDVDTTLVYFMGASQGGGDMLKYYGGSRGWIPRAYVSMNPNFSINTDTLKKYLDTIPAWFFQDDNDGTVGQTGTTYYNALHTQTPDGPHKLTQFVGEHQGPERTGFYDPSWSDDTSTRTSPAITNTTIYDWALMYDIDTTVVVDTPSYQIQISPTTKYWDNDTVLFQVNDVTSSDLVDSLFDGDSSTTFTSGFSTQNFYPSVAVLDLGGYYKIIKVSLYDHMGTDTLKLDKGQPLSWDSASYIYENANGWKDVTTSFYTRYLRIYYANSGYQKVSELKLYGCLVDDSLSRTAPELPTYTVPDMHDFIGVNVYGATPPEVRDVAGSQRKYTDQSFIDNTSPAGTILDSIKFSYTNTIESHGAFENYFFPNSREEGQTVKQWDNGYGGNFQQYDTTDITFFWSLKSIPEYAIDSGWLKSIDYTEHPNATSKEPGDYDRLSRMAWVLGAVYGENHYSIDSVQKIGTDTTTGAGIMHYIEAGNENNGSWLTTGYYTPQEAVAYHSAFFDGNENTMGSRMGIKNADSTIKVLMWGDASHDRIGYLKAMKYWSYYTRSDHRLPFDIFNIHDYFYYGTVGISPEDYMGGLRSYMRGEVDTVHMICPSCQVWLSEFGYDRNRQSPLAVPVIDGRDSARIQADWTARSWFQLSFSGLDKAQIFQIQNDGLSKDYDSTGTTRFNTTGLTSGHVNDSAFNYYAYPAYYFQHTIWKTLGNYKPDSIIYENNDSIYVYRYRNATNTDSVAYAIWSGTQTNRSTTNYAIKTGHASTSARIITLADKAMYGDTTTTSSGTDSTINLTITETPQILFTTEGKDGGVLIDNETPTHTPPTAHAGSDQTLDPGTTSTTLSGSATQGDGTITGYAWTETQGDATIVSPTSQNTSITGLQDGNTYVFRLTVTDSNDLTATDDVQVTVGSTSPPAGNMVFKWLKKYGAYYYVIYMNTSTGKYYYWKIL